MIGKSWDGTVANGVAATGVEGLETIVPISAISSWYDYYRDNGALYTISGGPDWLSGYVNGRPAEVCQPVRDALLAGSDNATGNYNAFWAERELRAGRPQGARPACSSCTASTTSTWRPSTSPSGGTRWRSTGCRARSGSARRGTSTRSTSAAPSGSTTLHRWFDYWLQGLHNGVMREPMATDRAARRTCG